MKNRYSIKTEIKPGQHLSVDTEIRIGEHLSKSTEFKKGMIPWNKGKHWSLKIKRKMSRARKNKHFLSTSKTMKLLWKNDKYRDKQVESIFKGWKIKPNKPEKILKKLLNKIFPNQFKYVGDGKLILNGLNPDFVDTKNKIIIEHYGTYWHKRPEIVKRDKKRIKTYTSYGYKTLVIWEHELKNLMEVAKKLIIFSKDVR